MATTVEAANLCIVCNKNSVTWPRVCDDCIDHEAQGDLGAHYGFFYVEDPMGGEGYVVTGMECKTCGMIYDGGMRCTYCGDADPLDHGDEDEDEDEEL